jgi:hypothetical protein
MSNIIQFSIGAFVLYVIIRLCIRGWWNDKTKHELEVIGNNINEINETESEDHKK